MKLKHIYFTKEGEPMANPEMEYPTFNAWRDSQEVEEQAKAKYHSGLLPFEDREKIKEILRVEKIMDAFENGKLQKLIDGKFDKHKPDTLIPVDLNIEIVTDKDGLRLIRII